MEVILEVCAEGGRISWVQPGPHENNQLRFLAPNGGELVQELHGGVDDIEAFCKTVRYFEAAFKELSRSVHGGV